MAQIFSADRIVPAWLNAVEFLRDNKGQGRNFILEVAEPATLTQKDRQAIQLVDDALRKGSGLSVNTVAATIFPQGIYARHGHPKFYDVFKEKMATAKKKGTWGTYALRLMERQGKDPGQTINPLEQVILKLQRASSDGHPYQAVYEMGVAEPADDLDLMDSFGCELPTFDVKLDGNRVRNMPCLSHLSFKLTDKELVDLTAIYRYHYYCQRTLGNLAGLSQLMAFVAAESGLRVGSLTCISTQAALDLSSWDSAKARGLEVITNARAALT
jgi:hypothetical protein